MHDTKQNMATQKNYSLTSIGDGNVIVIDENGENEVSEKQIGLGMSDQEPSIDVNDNDFLVSVHWKVDELPTNIAGHNKHWDSNAVEAHLRGGPLKDISKKCTIGHLTKNYTIEYQAKRLQAGPLKGLEFVAVRYIGVTGKEAKSDREVRECVIERLPYLVSKTKEWSWDTTMDLDDDDNSGFLYWDDDDLGRKLCQGDPKGWVKDALAAAPLEDTSNKITLKTPVVGGEIRLEAQGKVVQTGSLEGSQFVAIRVLDLKGCVAEQKKEVLDEHIAEVLPAVKQIVKECPFKRTKKFDDDGIGEWDDHDILIPKWDDDDISIPEWGVTDETKPWFVAFVKWIREKYYCLGSRLDPDNLQNLVPANETEAIYLNFLKFYDKYYSTRSPFKWAQKIKFEEPTCVAGGTDIDFHYLATIFVRHGPDYFVDNSDVKGKTQEELEQLRERPWRPYPSGGDSDFDSD